MSQSPEVVRRRRWRRGYLTHLPDLPATAKPTSKGDTTHVDWGTLVAARRRLGELRGEPRHAAARTPGRTPSASLTRAGSGEKRRPCTLRLMNGLGAAGQQLSARTGRRRRPQPRRWTCTRAQSVVMSAHATCSSIRARHGAADAWYDVWRRLDVKGAMCAACMWAEVCRERCSAAPRARRACGRSGCAPGCASVLPLCRAIGYGPAGGLGTAEAGCEPARGARGRLARPGSDIN